jgi:CubicO group peptidase (beta-lactamase class C family)
MADRSDGPSVPGIQGFVAPGFEGVAEAIAAGGPGVAVAAFVAGELICEHALTFGFLAGELVRRVDGRSLGTFFRDELAEPLGLDIHIGVPHDELPRVADTVGLTAPWWAEACGDPTSLRARSLGPLPDVNADAWRTAEIPAVNGHATALGLATWYQRLLKGRLPTLVDAPGVTGHDVFVDEEVTWTLAGGRIDGDDIGMR